MFYVAIALFVVFLILKLTNRVDWSWWWVTSPIWIWGIIFILGLLFIGSIFVGLVMLG